METNHYAEWGINPLTEDQRTAAYERARLQIAGREPTPDKFQKVNFQKYSPVVLRVITGLSIVGLIAAFAPSAMRLHAVALETNLQILQDAPSAYVAALATVLSAETGQVIFSLAQSAATSKLQKGALWLGVAVCTLIAFAGNAAAFGSHLQFDFADVANSVFAYLEAFAPPLLVLIIAQVLKSQILQADANRTAAHANYEAAYAKWEGALEHAPDAPNWRRELANAIRDALRDANKNSKAKLRVLSREQWILLVETEQKQSEWYVESEPVQIVQPAKATPIVHLPVQVPVHAIAIEQPRKAKSGGGGSSGTGETDAMVANMQFANGVYSIECICGKQITNPDAIGLKRAVSAHLRGCKSRGANLTDEDTKEAIPAIVE
jgi:hypothetical protein